MQKNADAFRTISEVADELVLPQHVLRFWETRFPQIRPLKRAGGRRYYRPGDIALLKSIRALLYDEGYTIKGVQRLLKEQGAKGLAASAMVDIAADDPPDDEVQDHIRSGETLRVEAGDEVEPRDEDGFGEERRPRHFQTPVSLRPDPDASRYAGYDRASINAAPAGLLGSIQRDALETALLVLEDCERILAPLVRRTA